MEKDVGIEHIFVVLLIGVLIIVGFLMAVREPPQPAITFGWIGPLSGESESIGRSAKAAAELAVREVNLAGGINGRQLELIYKDGGCDSSTAAGAARDLLEIDTVPVIIGGACSSETLGFVTMAEAVDALVVSYCSSVPVLTQLGDHIFRTYPSDDYQGKFAATYLHDQRGLRRLALLSCRSSYCNGIRKVFKEEFLQKEGSSIAADYLYEDAEELPALLTELQAVDPDAIYFLGYSDAAIGLFTELENLSWEVPVFGSDAMDDPRIGAESDAVGAQYSVITTDATDEFAAAIIAATGQGMTSCAAQSYDTVKLLAKIQRQDPKTQRDYIGALHTMLPYEGLSGTIAFDENGDLVDAKYGVKEFRPQGRVRVQ